MKIRTGFVSNSSSSSYVCQISGEAFEVHDGCFNQAGLAQCRAGHVFQAIYLVNGVPEYPSKDAMLAKLDEVTDSKRECEELRRLTLERLQEVYAERFLEGNCNGGDVDVNCCPICTMVNMPDSELLKFFLKEQKMTRKEAIQLVRAQYGNYTAFKRSIKNVE